MDAVTLPLYIVDSFTQKAFAGNPAAVCLISSKHDLSDETMQKIAAEMNLSTTAFVITSNDFSTDSKFYLRWFTPVKEIELCGHATLASTAVLYKCLGNNSDVLEFECVNGVVYTSINSNGLITLDFPRNDPIKLDEQETQDLQNLLKATISRLEHQEVCYSPETKYLIIRLQDSLTRKDLVSLKPSTQTMMELRTGNLNLAGVIVTLKGDLNNGCIDEDGKPYDFISRFFGPWIGISEDSVTGSAHTVSGPYWSQILSKNELYTRQCSTRGGDLYLSVKDRRVEISGNSAIVMKGQLNVPAK